MLDVPIIEEIIPEYSEEIDNQGACFCVAAELSDAVLTEQTKIESKEIEYQKHLSTDKVWRCYDCKLFLYSEDECSLCLESLHNVEKLNDRIKYNPIPDLRNYRHWNCYDCNRIFYSLDSCTSCYAADHDIKQLEKLPALPVQDNSVLDDGVDYDVLEDNFTQNYKLYIDAIKSGIWHDADYPSGLSLPGMLVNRESCGNWYTRGCIGPAEDSLIHTRATKQQAVLHKDGTVGVIKKHMLTCKQQSCIECFEYAINLQAKKIQERLEAHIVRLDSDLHNERVKRIFHHMIVSFNREQIELLKDEKFRKKTIKKIDGYMSKLGIEGGVRILHGWRFNQKSGMPYWSPHLHYIVTGYTKSQDIVAMFEKTGHVFHSISTFKNGKSAFNLSRYLLSHAAVSYRKQSYAYIGDAQNNKFSTSTILNNASDCNDSLDNRLTDIESGFLLSRKYTSCKVTRCDIQLFQHGTGFDLEDYTKQDEQSFRNGHVMKYVGDEIKKHIDTGRKDNPAKAKSDTVDGMTSDDHIGPCITHDDLSFVVMKIWFDANRIRADDIIEECEPVRYHVLRLEPNITGLCPICNAKMRTIIQKEPEQTPEFTKDQDYTTVHAKSWEYYEHLIHGKEGFPYYNEETGEFSKDIGQKGKNDHYDVQVPWLQVQQMDIIEDGMKSVFRHEFLDGNTKPDYGACFDYVADRLEYWRKEVRGVTIDNEKVKRDSMITKAIESGKQKQLF